MNENNIEIAPLEEMIIGGVWQKTINLVPSSGTLTITDISHKLMARESTTDLVASYVTGSASYSGSQVTTGQVGTGSIPPGRYTYFLLVTHSAGVYILYQNFEFSSMKGL